MISILAGIFIKNREYVRNPQVRRRYGMLCGAVGIFLNILLFTGKLLAGTISRSISITADAFNNLSDAASSVVTLIGFKMSGAEADGEHPFGHGRIEYISGFIVSGAILIMAFELIKSSVEKIIHGEPVEFSLLSVVILLVSICVKLYMAYYNHTIGKRIESPAMTAAATDSISDCCATTLVLAAAIVGKLTGFQIDGYCGVLVGIFIFYAGIRAAKETLNPLLGQPPKEEFVEQVEAVVLRHEEVWGIHDLIVHDYGPEKKMITLHVEVKAEGNLMELHEVVDHIEHELQEELGCEAVLHMDPVVTMDQRVRTLESQVKAALYAIDKGITMHDFRVVDYREDEAQEGYARLVFDIVVPFGYKIKDDELKKRIQDRIFEKMGKGYIAQIQVDKA